MDVAAWVNGARRSAGLSQRQLADRAGIPQPTIARIESGKQMPRADTLDRLLRACGWELHMTPLGGDAVDQDELARFLELSPRERLDRAAAIAQVGQAFTVPDDGRTLAGVLRAALEDSVQAAKGNDAGRPRRLD